MVIVGLTRVGPREDDRMKDKIRTERGDRDDDGITDREAKVGDAVIDDDLEDRD